MKTIYFQYWTESEAGWGQRPDGFILHLSLEDHKKFLDDYWDKMPRMSRANTLILTGLLTEGMVTLYPLKWMGDQQSTVIL